LNEGTRIKKKKNPFKLRIKFFLDLKGCSICYTMDRRGRDRMAVGFKVVSSNIVQISPTP